ncbi:hypothetical protein JZ751_014154 [Albula glossodonta]|uniref:Uncharacterized protein n=1 Tax=Albula glossodonta TaxID=121402 RepID=A0A8T2P3F8_9TELE|nr:hypothetical protein JZ751_014154 [Albula glossodonta]
MNIRSKCQHSPCSISDSFSAMFSKSRMTERAVNWWTISSQPSGPRAGPSVAQRGDKSTVTSQDTGLPAIVPWMTERHRAGGGRGSSGRAAANRYSGSVKLSQSNGEAGNSRPSGLREGEMIRQWDRAPRGVVCVSPSLSSSRPPSAWSKDTFSSARRSRCMSSSPCGEEKLRLAMADRARAFCLFRDSSTLSTLPVCVASISVLSEDAACCHGDSHRDSLRCSGGAIFSRPWGREPVSSSAGPGQSELDETWGRPLSLLTEQRVRTYCSCTYESRWILRRTSLGANRHALPVLALVSAALAQENSDEISRDISLTASSMSPWSEEDSWGRRESAVSGAQSSS